MYIAILGDMSYGSAFAGTNYKRGVAISSSIPDLDNYDLVVFTGGTDVCPSMYGHQRVEETSPPDNRRDMVERIIFHECVNKGIPMIGICRGAQFLNVMNGGGLIQHCTGHTANHPIRSFEPGFNNIQVTSTHHQMMVPTKQAVWEAWAVGLSSVYKHGFKEGADLPRDLEGRVREPEVVFYPETSSLCVQYHPEYMSTESPGYQYFNRLIYKYLMETSHV